MPIWYLLGYAFYFVEWHAGYSLSLGRPGPRFPSTLPCMIIFFQVAVFLLYARSIIMSKHLYCWLTYVVCRLQDPTTLSIMVHEIPCILCQNQPCKTLCIPQGTMLDSNRRKLCRAQTNWAQFLGSAYHKQRIGACWRREFCVYVKLISQVCREFLFVHVRTRRNLALAMVIVSKTCDGKQSHKTGPWCRTVMAKMREMRLTWGEVQMLPFKERVKWKEVVAANVTLDRLG